MADRVKPIEFKRIQKAISIGGSLNTNDLNKLLEDGFTVVSTTAQHIGSDTSYSANILVILEKYEKIEIK